jgi:hypothetical protein
MAHPVSVIVLHGLIVERANVPNEDAIRLVLKITSFTFLPAMAVNLLVNHGTFPERARRRRALIMAMGRGLDPRKAWWSPLTSATHLC